MQATGNIARIATSGRTRQLPRRSAWRWLICLLLTPFVLQAAELDDARQLFLTGKYKECIKATQKEIEDSSPEEEWRLLLIKSLMNLGRYPDALGVVTTNLNRYYGSVQLRMVAREVFLHNGQEERARSMLEEINQLAGSRAWAYRDPGNLVTLGRAALLVGGDPKLVLEKLYDPAKKADPSNREVYLASGDLALDKNDFLLASKAFQDGLKKFPTDADMLYGFARCFPNERTRMIFALEKALQANSNHVASLLLLTDHLVDAEEYGEAKEILDRIIAINPVQPNAWAFRAVLAHLENDGDAERKARRTALKHWDTNPNVDHLIGRKLSQKYRFTEGAKAQRQALKYDKEFLPAKIQLAQDLLRLGEEEEGWELATEVSKDDGYDVTAYNLVTLKDTLNKFTTLTNENFVVRMGALEAQIYGQRVLELLSRAKTNLCDKYGLKLEKPTIVEIFPEQKDFGVRTFGIPDNPGFLGVCFGAVITANSPASQTAHPSNWEAVLWHEFCHVVTLQLTHNKMPRWLSEGISVYEELQANPVWGQAMTPRYRDMVLEGELTPVGDLSAAFLAPKSDMHLQFAYYESNLVVEYLVKKYGIESIKKILKALGEGVTINDAIAKHTATLDIIEKGFSEFARDRAEKLAPTLEWNKPKRKESDPSGFAKLMPFPTPDPKDDAGSVLDRLIRKRSEEGGHKPGQTNSPPKKSAPAPKPPPEEDPAQSMAEWVAKNPNNFYALMQQGKQLVDDKKWQEAKAPLQKLISAYPGYVGGGNAYTLLAAAHRGLNETKLERDVLTQLASRSADDLDTFSRLMELGAAEKDWAAVPLNAQRFLAVNPLVPHSYRHLAQASEELNAGKTAVGAYSTLLLLDPPDPAEIHFRLAKIMHQSGDLAAKRHVLQALEEAPRFRDAHRLLLQINQQMARNQTPAPGVQPTKGK
jgi:tetratricopeptide (TPR) repeat protein